MVVWVPLTYGWDPVGRLEWGDLALNRRVVPVTGACINVVVVQ